MHLVSLFLVALIQHGEAVPQVEAAAPVETTPQGETVQAGDAVQSGEPVQDVYAPKLAEASGEGERALAGMAIPEGWTASLWAAEPLLANPVIFSIDDRGEVYVCETFRLHRGVTDMRNYMGWLDDELAATTVADRRAMFEKHLTLEEVAAWSTEHERLRLVRDTDGDGVADTATVFADGFNDLMDGIAAGVLNVDGDVYYTCIPHLWKLRDEDGDGVSDARESLGHGFGVHVALLGHDLHGLVLGPDRRLYFSCGDRGINLTTGSGQGIELPHEGAVLRCELDGSNMEVVHKGLRNPQELVFDTNGDLFTGDNNSDGGDRARWVNIVPGGDSGWRHHYQYVTEPILRGPWNDEQQWKPPGECQSAWNLPPIANLGAGPSGLDFAPGTGLPPELDGHFFLCDFRGDPGSSGVWSFALERKGAFYAVTDQQNWLWKTLVTDFQFGPDGYAYWSDWVAGWGMTGKGRIYRMRWDGVDAELVEETRALLAGSFDALATPRLEGLLPHPDRRVRQRAHFALADRGAEGVGVLTRVAAKHPSRFARLHAIWGLWVAGKSDSSAVRSLGDLLRDDDSDVRSQAARVLGDLRIKNEGKVLVKALDDADARVRFQAALACGRIGAEGARPGLERMLVEAAATNDPNLRHAAVQGLIGCVPVRELERLNSADDAVALGYLLAMRTQRSSRLHEYLERSAPLAIEAARAIYENGDMPSIGILSSWPLRPTTLEESSDDRPQNQVEAGNRLREDPRFQELIHTPAFIRRVIAAKLVWPGGCASIASLIGIARWDLDDAVRAELLQILAHRDAPNPRDMISGRWHPLDACPKFDLTASLPQDLRAPGVFPGTSEDVQVAWIALIEGMRKAPERQLECLSLFFDDTNRPGEVRARALEALVRLHPEAASTAVDRALADEDADLRAAALEALGHLEPEVALSRLSGVLTNGTLPERRAAYRVLRGLEGASADGLVADELVKLGAGLISPELSLDLVLAAEGREAPLVVSLLEARSTVAASLDPPLAPYVHGLLGGNVARGKQLFESTELSCLRCHSVTGDWSAQIGPSLDGLPKRMTRLEMLASIVEPNRRTTRGFEAELFFLFDEQPVVGRVHVETPDSVQVIDAEGVLHAIQKSDIEVRKKDLSAMPNGLADSISREEMRDLLAYLGTL